MYVYIIYRNGNGWRLPQDQTETQRRWPTLQIPLSWPTRQTANSREEVCAAQSTPRRFRMAVANQSFCRSVGWVGVEHFERMKNEKPNLAKYGGKVESTSESNPPTGIKSVDFWICLRWNALQRALPLPCWAPDRKWEQGSECSRTAPQRIAIAHGNAEGNQVYIARGHKFPGQGRVEDRVLGRTEATEA